MKLVGDKVGDGFLTRSFIRSFVDGLFFVCLSLFLFVWFVHWLVVSFKWVFFFLFFSSFSSFICM